MLCKTRIKKISFQIPKFCLLLFSTFSICIFAQPNLLTGQATHQVQISQSVVLRYESNIDNTLKTRNEVSAGGWCGLGWKLGFQSIEVVHNNTVDMRDDNWYIDDGYGNYSEIVRTYDNSLQIENFSAKNSPLQKIRIFDNNPGENQLRIIKGWEITSLDGTIYRYGFIPGQSDDMLPYLPCWGNYIGKGKTGYSTPAKFFHKWPLREVEDINHKKMLITYTNVSGQTSAGFLFTRESYPQQVQTALGNTIQFTLAAQEKNINEGSSEPFIGDFDFIAKKFLRGISLIDAEGKSIEYINFSYSGDPGQIGHLKNNIKGFAERLLTGVTYTNKKGNDEQFSYDPSTGQLISVKKPEVGSSTVYEYSSSNENIEINFSAGLASDLADGWKLINAGNHLFCQRTVQDTKLEVRLYSKVGFEWVMQNIPGITTLHSLGAQLIPYKDRFILYKQISSSETEVCIYQWLDNEWKLVEDHTGPLLSRSFVHGPDFVVEYQYKKIDVYGKNINDNEWSLLRSFDYATPDHWRNIMVSAARDYFVYSWTMVPEGESATQRDIKIFRRGVTGWNEIASTMIDEEYNLNEFELITFDDYFATSHQKRPISGSQVQHCKIMRWNPILERFDGEFFSGTSLNNSVWPRLAKIYFHKDYAVILENDYLTHDGSYWMMIYRYLKQADGSFAWVRTYIRPDDDVSCPPLQVQDAVHSFFAGIQYPYAKKFRYSNGNNLRIGEVHCQDRHFFVTGGYPNGYCWDFRWEGDDVGPAATGWESKIGRSDYNCQGHNFNNPYFDNPDGDDSYAFPDLNATMTTETIDGQSCRVLWSLNYDFETGTFGILNPMATLDRPDMRIFPGNQSYCTIYSVSGPELYLDIFERYHSNYGVIRNIKSVQTMVKTDEMANQISLTNNFSEGKKFFDLNKGTSINSVAIATNGNGSAAGNTRTEFCLDSTIGTFGQVYSVSQHASNANCTSNDDTVRISGFLMELDGYSPKKGWAGVGLLTGPQKGAECLVDPITGYFSTKMNNPAHAPFSLYYIIAPETETAPPLYQWVFSLLKPFVSWHLDYPGRSTPIKSISLDFNFIANWKNVKINFGNKNGQNCTQWNEVRRPDAISATYNFFGKKQYDISTLYRVFQPRFIRNVSITNNVHNVTETPFDGYDEHNNLPSLSYSVNSDGSLVATKTIFAHDQYLKNGVQPGMDASDAHMLIQPSGNVVSKISAPEIIEWESASQIIEPAGRTDIPFLTEDAWRNLELGDKVYTVFCCALVGNYTDDDVHIRGGVNGIWKQDVTIKGPPNSPYVELFEGTINWWPITEAPSFRIVFLNYQAVIKIRCYIYKKRTLTEFNQNAVSASASTWNKASGVWRVDSNYVWNVNMTSSGLPESPLVDFLYSNPVSNTPNNWNLASTVDRYSSYGAVVQQKIAGRGPISSMFGTSAQLPVATASNAGYTECGVFTGDYRIGTTTGYWDYENGWEKGADGAVGLVDGANAHFGSKSIHVIRDYAAGRNNRIFPGKAYVMTAWVKVTSGTIRMETDFRYADNENWPAAPLRYAPVAGLEATPIASTDCGGKWKLMRLDIPASVTSQLDPDEICYARAWVGGDPSRPSFEAYVDDVRFYPAGALVTSTYYDPKWRTPIISVDANNNPGVKTYLDAHGRPAEIKKINKNDPAMVTPLLKKRYHLMGDCDSPIFVNDYETASVDFSTNACGSAPVIVANGNNGTNCLRVVEPANCLVYKVLTDSRYFNQMCVLEGFYKAPAAYGAQVGIYAVLSDATQVGIGNTPLSATDNQWIPFKVYFDSRGVTGTIASIQVQLSADNSSNSLAVHLDDLKIGAPYVTAMP